MTTGRSEARAQNGDRQLEVRAIYDSELLRGSAGYMVSQQLFEQLFPAAQNTDLQVYVKLKPGVDPASIDARLPELVERRMMPSVNALAPNEHLRIQLWLEPITKIHLDPVPSSFAPETDPAPEASGQ